MRSTLASVSIATLLLTAGCVSDPSVLAYYPSGSQGAYAPAGTYGNPYISNYDRPSKKELKKEEEQRRLNAYLQKLADDREDYERREREKREEREREERRKGQEQYEQAKKLIERSRTRPP
ncbi:hypothetical protein [Niveispirillum sp. KHB5.9]|uniref:hypothetical protein n=1 Tax=Niveispirillum sp. KHB5.9 TaxID=3400269 RepID=UPI003A87AB53